MLRKLTSLFAAVCLLLLWGCSGPSDYQAPLSDLSSEPGPSAGLTPAAPETAAELSAREKAWREDLEFLRAKYKELHPAPFKYVSEEEFDFRLEQLKRRIPELSDTDMYFEIRKLVAGFCDVHTTATGPDYLYERLFPFSVISLGEKVYMYLYDEKYAGLLEPCFLREIVAVNGVDMSYIRQKASELLYPTNSWYNKEYLPYYFYLPALLDWAGCGHQEGYTFHILNEDNQVELIEVPVVTGAVDLAYDCCPKDFSVPESFRETAQNYAKYIGDERGGCVYIRFSHMAEGSKGPYDELLGAAAALLKEHPNSKLAVDLRGNSGGNSNVQLFTRQIISDWGGLPIEKTYIITGGFMMSAAIDLSTVFKEGLDGITVGEPTGQFPGTFGNSASSPRTICLPNSQISVYIADMWHSGMHPEEYSHNENGFPYEWQNTVLPDVYVSADAGDFRQGRDSVIEWILEH